MWFIIGIVILILIIPILIDIIILLICGIGLLLKGIFEILITLLSIVGNVLLTIISPTVETINYAFAKDKSEWNEIIEKREEFKKHRAIKKKSGEKTRDYYFRFAKRSLFLLLRLVGLSYFAAAATLIIILSTSYIIATCFPHSFAPYLIGIIILVLTLPLTVCIAPIQDRIQLLPNLFLLHVLILWIQFCKIISMETVFYIACFEMFVYILCSFFHAVFIAELLEQQSHLLKQNNR
ncbi:hypothetical protein [Bartonella krasnovii]|uniref:Uncharacterized protein n=1 Tax=Bartonella krasnovii TaxID=2267275 RepID=A0A5B9D2H0_9HYPH|nr:hypothetical protein [Bartonella krasnovii]QEE12144.1 hypothetical protein D1092_03835 [Bartonella krasnovii]UNF37704.1 hypothetical protein MNL11_02900 [Bartonella krasnovii]UNF39666.1 hypothetical protein MNL10_04455 [Bartonella krasnovii]UNF42954.1 hypothetical protein MNL08_03780 [Bartonella krasnovii]UNF46216.1 hypothetical protein MNL06_03795 [Bartonella krasnovii]